EASVEHARPLENAAGAVFDVKLVARLSSERLPLVGADLGADVERAQKSECTTGGCRAGEVEMETDLPPPEQGQPAGEVKDRRRPRQPVALARGRDSGQLGTDVLRERHLRAPVSVACSW